MTRVSSDDKKLKVIRVPGGKTERFLVDKGPLEGLPGTKIQVALESMPNGGRVGAKPVSEGFRRSAASAKAFGVPPKGVKVQEWKLMSPEKRATMRKAEVERKRKARASRSPEEKKAKENRRRSAKAAAEKVRHVGSDHMKRVAKKVKTAA